MFFLILNISIIIKYCKRKKEKRIFKDYNNLKYGLIDEEEERKDALSSSVGASIED
jgi:hypothetical protein